MIEVLSAQISNIATRREVMQMKEASLYIRTNARWPAKEITSGTTVRRTRTPCGDSL